MSERTEGVSATVIPFPGSRAQRDRNAVLSTSPRGVVQTMVPILSIDGWYHEAAMREDTRGLHS